MYVIAGPFPKAISDIPLRSGVSVAGVTSIPKTISGSIVRTAGIIPRVLNSS